MPGSQRVLLFGASGTIGRAVANALKHAGHEVICVVRRSAQTREALADFALREANLLDPRSIANEAFGREKFDIVISCLASRSGTPEDAWAIDYQANSDILETAVSTGTRHFILLSAICVQKPRLAFQHAKLAFEAELRESSLTWSIIRPTAFFKSLSGQISRVQQGKPYLLFGDGQLTRCKPISDGDLARYIVGCIDDTARHNQIMPIGGPGPAITPLEQGERLFELTGKSARYRRVPVTLMSIIIGTLTLAGLFSKRAAAKAEYARIGQYYATESMLVWDDEAGCYSEDATPEFGSDTLFDHYAKITSQT